MHRRLRLLAALAMVAAIGAGCSSEPADTSGGNSTTTAATTTREKAMKFAQCMRDNGVKDFPDPDPSGELTVDGVLNGTSTPDGINALNAAGKKCRDHAKGAGVTVDGKYPR